VRLPTPTNVAGVAREVTNGLKLLQGTRSRRLWLRDLATTHAGRAGYGGRSDKLRLINLRNGINLHYRLNAGDLQGFREVWLDETYRVPVDLGEVHSIVDLGANIGLTSVYLAHTHQARNLVAVEPVRANAEVARSNLAINGIVGSVIEAAIGLGDGATLFEESTSSNRGRVADSGILVRQISMDTVMRELGTTEIDILKMDIEGHEDKLLRGDTSWLGSVRCLMIEFHPPLADVPVLVRSLQDQGFTYFPTGSVFARSVSTFVRRGAATRPVLR
jgi:FkbM family methyltransferase